MRWTTIVVYSPDFMPIAIIMTNGKRFFLADFFNGRMKKEVDFSSAMEDLMQSRFVN